MVHQPSSTNNKFRQEQKHEPDTLKQRRSVLLDFSSTLYIVVFIDCLLLAYTFILDGITLHLGYLHKHDSLSSPLVGH